MERRKIYLLIFFLLILLFAIIYILLNSKLSSLYKIHPVEDESSIQDTVSCDPGGVLQKCDILGDPCIQCKDGLYSCQEVNEPLEIKDENGTPITVPKGKWCLPAVVQSVHSCDLETSTPILTKYSDGLYKWRCYCKFPNWVTASSIDGDCDKQIACNHQEDPTNNYLAFCQKPNGDVVDSIIKDGEFTCPEGSDIKKWEPKDQIDLEKHSFCKCGPGLIYNQNIRLDVKECVKNPCGAGTIYRKDDGSLGCVCPDGKISCDNLPLNKRAECSIGCIDDPCKPHGKYKPDMNDGKGGCQCDCDEKVGDTCVKGYIFMPNENFLANGYCEKIDSACDAIMGDNLINGDCNINRGGECITCPVSAGYGDAKVNVPYCVNCGPDRGFMGDPVDMTKPGAFCNSPKNCGTCGLWFTECKGKGKGGNVQDSLYCCTGRCANSGDWKDQCQPCNGDVGQDDSTWSDEDWNDGFIRREDDDRLRQAKQGRWDDHCNEKTHGDRQFCNSYNIAWPSEEAPPEYPGWKSQDNRIGICESEKKPDHRDEVCFMTEGALDTRRVCRYGYT